MTCASSRSDDPAAQPDWTAIRQAYVGRGVNVSDICRAHGINTQTLYRQADREAWPRRRERKTTAEERKTLRLLARLRRLAAGQIDAIEARRGSRKDPERDARALMALVKLVEHITALEARHQVRRDGSGGDFQADRAQRRADLADKLIAMLEQERGAPLPEGHSG